MLEIRDLKAGVGGRELLKGITLSLRPGEVHAVMGPNGAGKTTLAMALMGHPDYHASGSVRLDGGELMGIPADERAKRGLFLAFQNPAEVEGVKVGNVVRKAVAARGGPAMDLDRMVGIQERLMKDSSRLGLDRSLVGRELNVGFSGGEKKRLEVLQMLSLAPKAVVMDEVDSGLDADGIRTVAKAVSSFNDGKRVFLMITHYPRMLRHLKPHRVHILASGRIAASGGASLAHEIEENGYARFLKDSHAGR